MRLRALPLRVQLVVAMLVLLALGLLVTGVTASTALRGYLLGRVDNQLQSVSGDLQRSSASDVSRGNGGRGRGGSGGGGPDGRRPDRLNAYYVQVRDRSGSIIGTPLRTGSSSTPLLPSGSLATDGPFTVSSSSNQVQWRVLVTSLADGSGQVVVAAPTGDVNGTVHRLVLLNLGVSVVVLVLSGGLAYLLVSRSLRPLVAVENTAEAIAAGDLSQRVPELDPRTEVGRVSGALNSMLDQVEVAFEAQRASEGQARTSEQRMRRFIADASHELRTPLTSIRGFAELYRQGAVSGRAEVDRVMRRVEDEAARMGLLVEELLLLARLDQQRPLETFPVDLLVVASDAVHDAQAVAPDRAISLDVNGDAPAVVAGDDARLRQVFANLLTNALVHTPAGTPVKVRLQSDDEHVAVEVTDAGPGMDQEQASRVFERFYRADPSRTRASGGYGLGLSIVAALVAAHGGTVGVTSAPGEGATFRVVLPAAA